MVPIAGKPLLLHHIEMLRDQGFRDLIINLHHLPEKITSFFGDGRDLDVHITYSLEPELLGTAGAVKRMAGTLAEGSFLVIYGDNLLKLQLAPLVEFHHRRRAIATVALFESPEPWTGGVVESAEDGRVRRFLEKPARNDITTNLISAGILVLEPSVLESVPEKTFCDFGRDVFPRLVDDGAPFYAIKPQAYIQDVGTPERLEKARRDYEHGLAELSR
jgi:NDP-sugar pyrophosphorylase family protein